MYRLLATDMDGTLLNGVKLISRENAVALRRAVRQGVQLAICTGRPYRSAWLHARTAGLRPWILSANGSIAHDPDGRVRFTAPMADALARTVITVLRRYRIPFHMYTPQAVVAEVDAESPLLPPVTWSRYHSIRGMAIAGVNRLLNRPRLVADATALLTGNRTCLKFFCPEGEPGALNQCLAEIRKMGLPLAISASATDNFELNAEGVNKGTGLAWLAGTLGIAQAEVIAVGDHLNDLEMLRWAGMGVAVANAVPKAKAAADHVTVAHTEDAVAAVVRTFITSQG